MADVNLDLSAVPSGSAGEPTPTTATIKVPAAQYKSASEADSAASRLPPDEVMREMIDAVLAFDPGEVPEAVAIEWCTEVAMRTPAFQGWLSAVAAAATAQTTDVWAEVDALRAEFATLKATEAEIRADERERCAQVCEARAATMPPESSARNEAEKCARAIRIKDTPCVIAEAASRVRALAGGAPPATQTTDTTEE